MFTHRRMFEVELLQKFDSWKDFIASGLRNCNLTYRGDLLYWYWDHGQDIDGSDDEKLQQEGSNESVHFIFPKCHSGVIRFAIKTTRQDEPNIRKFIRKEFQRRLEKIMMV